MTKQKRGSQAITHTHRETKQHRSFFLQTRKRGFAKTASFSQIFLLVISIVAFTWAIGSEVGEVSGVDYRPPKDMTPKEIYDAAPNEFKTYYGTQENLEKVLKENNFLVVSNQQKVPGNRVISYETTSFLLPPFGNKYKVITEKKGKKSILVKDKTSFVKLFSDIQNSGLPNEKKKELIEDLRDAQRIAQLNGVEGIQVQILEISEGGNLILRAGSGESAAAPSGTGTPVKPTKVAVEPTEAGTEEEIAAAREKAEAEAKLKGAEAKKQEAERIAREKAEAEEAAKKEKKPKTQADIDAACLELKNNPKTSKTNPALCYGFWGIIGESAGYAVLLAGTVQVLGPIFGLSGKQTDMASKTTAVGVLAYKLTSDFATKSAAESKFLGVEPGKYTKFFAEGNGATYAGLTAAAVYFLAKYRDEDSKKVDFSCVPWQASLGGGNCETCNQGFLPCSEYQCKSLGQSCELVNPGTNDEKCVWVNRNDVTAPIIEAWTGGLLNEDYRYNPDSAVLPPDRGVKVEYLKSAAGDNCIPAFTPLRIGINSNEPAKCKVDGLRKNDFETMDVLMSQGLLQYNHTFSLSLPGSDNLNSSGIKVQNDGNYDLFIRCEDANGNANEGTFVFKYCIDKGPDVTPPLIVATSIPNNAPVAYNQTSLNLEVYVNEPSECKWSHNNREYDSMEVQMQCDTFIRDNNAQGLYTCKTTLEGIKDRFVNKFYFKCKDKPQAPENERNENQESFEYSIIGTQALVIDYALPNDTIRDSTSAVKVTFETKTSAGFDEGKAECFYSDTGNDDDYVRFFETNSHLHKQDLFLPSGSYIYYIRCIDLGGNRDDETITFTVESDNVAPIVVRAYHEEQYLKLITNEEAKCVYDVVDCSYPFDSGIPITEIDGVNHFTDWNIKKNLYVKCQDLYGNQPLPNQCNIIVKSSDF